jgi:hypothetical protein
VFLKHRQDKLRLQKEDDFIAGFTMITIMLNFASPAKSRVIGNDAITHRHL